MLLGFARFTLVQIYIVAIILLFITCKGAQNVQSQTIELENLGSVINSPYTEVLPRISPDGKVLYFVRSEHPENIGGNFSRQDVWYSRLDNGNWTKALNIGPPINNIHHNAVNAITADGNTLLLLNRYLPNGVPGVGASTSYRTRNGWSFPKDVIIKDYINHNIYGSFNLGVDGKTMIIECQDDNSLGENDLYVSFLQEDGGWTKPVNLGAEINTPNYEVSPFLAADGRTLYFATDGRKGYGSFDIYMTKRLDDTWLKWSEPINLGEPINSDGFDAYFTLPADGTYAYLVSSHGTVGETDIFRVKLKPEIRPDAVILVSGRVLNQKNLNPVEAEITLERLSDGKEFAKARTDPQTGAFALVLPPGEKYGFHAKAPGFISVNENLDASQVKEYKEIVRDIKVVPIAIGEKVVLNNLFFDFAKAELRPTSFAELTRIIQILNEHSTIQVEIGGHTDNIGKPETNKKLSLERATVVAQYIIQKGMIDAQRIRVAGYGESQPMAPNDSDDNRQLNRRVELKIIAK